MQVDSRYDKIYWTIVDRWVPHPIPLEDEDNAAYDQGISYGDVQTVDNILTMGLMEQIDHFKRATRKRDYNFSLYLQGHSILGISGAI